MLILLIWIPSPTSENRSVFFLSCSLVQTPLWAITSNFRLDDDYVVDANRMMLEVSGAAEVIRKQRVILFARRATSRELPDPQIEGAGRGEKKECAKKRNTIRKPGRNWALGRGMGVLKEERSVKEGREKWDLFHFELMECVPTHQLSSARLWGSREGSGGENA